jgi:hypothetical protein
MTLDVVEDVRLSPPQMIGAIPPEGEWRTEAVQVYSLTGRGVVLHGVEKGADDPNFAVEIRDGEVRVRVRGTADRAVLERTFYLGVESGGKSYRLPLYVSFS